MQGPSKQNLETSQELIDAAERLWKQATEETDSKKKQVLEEEAKRLLTEARKLAGLRKIAL